MTRSLAICSGSELDRHLVLIDIENIVGNPLPSADEVRLARCQLRTIVPDFGTAQVIVACSHKAAAAVAFEFPTALRRWRSGPDGADLALLAEMGDLRSMSRFRRLTLCSGDGIFAESLAALAGASIMTTVVSPAERLSRRLRLAAQHVVVLDGILGRATPGPMACLRAIPGASRTGIGAVGGDGRPASSATRSGGLAIDGNLYPNSQVPRRVAKAELSDPTGAHMGSERRGPGMPALSARDLATEVPISPSRARHDCDIAERAFHRDMLHGCDLLSSLGYRPTRFRQDVANHGAVATVKKLLGKAGTSDGFSRLWEMGRLDLSAEAFVLLPWYCDLFDEAERRIAHDRLQRHGFDVARYLSNLPAPPRWAS